MIGKLQRIETSKELIERIAKDEFSPNGSGDLETHDEHIKQTYRDIAIEIIEDFNYAVGVFSMINMFCTVEEPGCWDVEEYYDELGDKN